MSVLDREFFNFCIVRAPLDAVVQAFDNYPPMRVKTIDAPFVFPTQPHSRGDTEISMLLWSPAAAPQFTAFMPSVSAGDYFFTSYCAQFKFEVVALRSTAKLAIDQVNEFIAYAGGSRVRVVQALQDSPRWVFFQSGDPMPFETVEWYQSRLVRNRLTRDSVLTYVQFWGAPVRDPEFWETNRAAVTFVRKDG